MRNRDDRSKNKGQELETTPEESARLASGQKLLIAAMMLQYGGPYGSMDLGAARPFVVLLALLAAMFIFGYGVVLIGKALRWTNAIIALNLLFMMIPLVNFIALWRLNGKATEVLRRSGYKVGFFGASKIGD
jgi:hypothetical protein